MIGKLLINDVYLQLVIFVTFRWRDTRDIEMCSWTAPDLAWRWRVFKLLITEGLDLDLDLGVLNVLNFSQVLRLRSNLGDSGLLQPCHAVGDELGYET